MLSLRPAVSAKVVALWVLVLGSFIQRVHLGLQPPQLSVVFSIGILQLFRGKCGTCSHRPLDWGWHRVSSHTITLLSQAHGRHL